MKERMIKIDDMRAVCLGLIGGVYQWFLNINLPTDFYSKLLEAMITAALCGAAGWIGKAVVKTVYLHFKTSFINYFKKRKKSNNDVGQH